MVDCCVFCELVCWEFVFDCGFGISIWVLLFWVFWAC